MIFSCLCSVIQFGIIFILPANSRHLRIWGQWFWLFHFFRSIENKKPGKSLIPNESNILMPRNMVNNPQNLK